MVPCVLRVHSPRLRFGTREIERVHIRSHSWSRPGMQIKIKTNKICKTHFRLHKRISFGYLNHERAIDWKRACAHSQWMRWILMCDLYTVHTHTYMPMCAYCVRVMSCPSYASGCVFNAYLTGVWVNYRATGHCQRSQGDHNSLNELDICKCSDS